MFVSQLEVDALPQEAQALIRGSITSAQDLLSAQDKQWLQQLKEGKELTQADAKQLVEHLLAFFARPWDAPLRPLVEELNTTSQYAAWTLLHGNAVNHYTAFINYQQVADWPDIEATIAALAADGIPMKDNIEGERGNKLRQSSTKAVTMQCEVREADGSKGSLEWTYAYYELAERG